MKRKPGKMSLEDIEDLESYPEHLENELKFFKWAGKKWAKDILKFLFQDGNKERKRILDVGSGTGIIPRALIKVAQAKGLNIEVIGIDKLPSIITFAKKKAEEEKLKNISFLEGGALKIPFPENHFDLVTASFLFNFLDEQELQKFFKETYRVLKPRGKFYFLHPLRSFPMYLVIYLYTHLITRKKRSFKLDAIKHSYTVDETEALVSQSSLSGRNVIVRKKYGPLFIEVLGTINKSQKG